METVVTWTEEMVRDFTRKCVDRYYYETPSMIVLKTNTYGETGWRFDKMRSVVENEIQLYKQKLKK